MNDNDKSITDVDLNSFIFHDILYKT